MAICPRSVKLFQAALWRKLVRHCKCCAFLNGWWRGRAIIPKRYELFWALPKLGVDSVEQYTRGVTTLPLKSYALSLSDHYWIRPAGEDLKWEAINLFENDFSPDIGNILFGGDPPEQVDFMSPDSTTDGRSQKKWIVVDGKRLLMKAGSGDYQQEPFNELIASAIMRRLGISHVPYTLTFERDKPYSLCETFVTLETEFVPAFRVIQVIRHDGYGSALPHLLRCTDALGIPNVRSDIEKMLVLDYIIANTQRHWNNFGFIRNADTLEWHGLAPIYDCGTSLEFHAYGLNTTSKTFRSTHSQQINLVHDLSWFYSDKLEGIGNECAKILERSTLIYPERRMAIVHEIEERIKLVAQRKKRISGSGLEESAQTNDPADLEQDLPPFLQESIAAFVKAETEQSSLWDCYWCELASDINVAEDGLISSEQAHYLRGKYLYDYESEETDE